MSKTYSLLKDELAISEIRKHQWIESEKQGREIGFATAALDWFRRYGPAWLKHRLDRQQNGDPLIEKRQYRRFDSRFPVQLKFGDSHIFCHTDNVNLIGLTCTIPTTISQDTATDVTIRFRSKITRTPQPRFEFTSRITRVHPLKAGRRDASCRIFIPFTENVRDFIRSNTDALNN